MDKIQPQKFQDLDAFLERLDVDDSQLTNDQKSILEGVLEELMKLGNQGKIVLAKEAISQELYLLISLLRQGDIIDGMVWETMVRKFIERITSSAFQEFLKRIPEYTSGAYSTINDLAMAQVRGEVDVERDYPEVSDLIRQNETWSEFWHSLLDICESKKAL